MPRHLKDTGWRDGRVTVRGRMVCGHSEPRRSGCLLLCVRQGLRRYFAGYLTVTDGVSACTVRHPCPARASCDGHPAGLGASSWFGGSAGQQCTGAGHAAPCGLRAAGPGFAPGQSTVYTTGLCRRASPVDTLTPCLPGSPPPPPGGPPPLHILGADRGQVPRRGACGQDGALHPEVNRVGVLVQDCPSGRAGSRSGRVVRDVAGGV